MLTLFTFNAGDLATTTAYIGDVLNDAKELIALAIGIPLAFYVIHKFVELFTKPVKGYSYEDFLKEEKDKRK